MALEIEPKFVDLRQQLETIERDRLEGRPLDSSAENEVLLAWQALPDTFGTLKTVAFGILSIFSSSYSCESLFTTTNLIKSDIRNRLADDTSAACVALKTTMYKPDIKQLASFLQQQKSH